MRNVSHCKLGYICSRMIADKAYTNATLLIMGASDGLIVGVKRGGA